MGGRGRGRGLCHLRLQLYGHDGGKEDKDLLEWSGQLTGQRHLAQHSAFSTANFLPIAVMLKSIYGNRPSPPILGP